MHNDPRGRSGTCPTTFLLLALAAPTPPGRLRDHGFRTRRWTVVSPQNQHLDVWGAVVAPDTTVFWITAHFLNAAARFLELGASIWQ
jgi:hypothetical protein